MIMFVKKMYYIFWTALLDIFEWKDRVKEKFLCSFSFKSPNIEKKYRFSHFPHWLCSYVYSYQIIFMPEYFFFTFQFSKYTNSTER
jgi:hypothetical protein